MTKKPLTQRFIFWAIVTIIVWAGIPVLAKLGSGHLNGFEMTFWVNLSAMPMVTLWVLPKQHRQNLANYPLKIILLLVGIGFLGNLISELFFFSSYRTITALAGSVLSQSGSILFVVASMLFLKERHSRINLVAVVLVTIGAILSVVKPGEKLEIAFNIGFWLMILSTLSNTGYNFINNSIKKTFPDARANLFIYKLSTLIVIGIWAVLTGGHFISVNPSLRINLNPPVGDILFPFAIGVFGDGIGFLAWLKLLEFGDSVKATIVNAIVVVVEVVLAAIIYRETASVINAVLAPLLVIVPTTLAGYMDAKSKKKATTSPGG